MSYLIKLPDEARQYSFDFSAQTEIAAGDTLTGTPTVTATALTGGAALTLGSPSRVGAMVHVVISGGAIGENYQVKCVVGTTAGRTLSAVGELRVRSIL